MEEAVLMSPEERHSTRKRRILVLRIPSLAKTVRAAGRHGESGDGEQ